MKITDKIVTSITQPQQTNVLWHNPETGELDKANEMKELWVTERNKINEQYPYIEE